MATSRHKLSTYALTISTYRQYRHFQRSANAELFVSKLFGYRDQGRFQLHGFAVMPDHVHILLTPALDQPTARCVLLIKGSYSSSARSQREIWHSGYHEHRVRDLSDFQNQLAYIANNPARKHFSAYPHVHTHFRDQLDRSPYHLAAESNTLSPPLPSPRST